MCQQAANTAPLLSGVSVPSVQALTKGLLAGSRRTKLWELPDLFHCPVIGVCLSTKAIQRLVAKVAPGQVPASDYACHSVAVNACRQRGPLSELLQKDLDARHELAIRRCRPLATPSALLAAWTTAIAQGDIAGCFWALLTHPKITAPLRERIYRDVHMLQHQAGASIRVDLQAFEALGRENAVLIREMGKIQRRMSDFVQDKTAQLDKLGAELLQRDQDIVRLKSELAAREAENRQLERAAGLLQQNLALQAAVERLTGKVQAQADELARLRASPPRAAATPVTDGLCASSDALAAPAAPAPRLEQKTVFVVGGRLGSFNEYRCTVEQSGARFLFHDGGLEHSMQTLESGLQAADYVICQTGCISHASYWKVKDFCKRTGTRCVYVESPGVGALQQSIQRLGSIARGEDQPSTATNANDSHV